MSFCIVYLASPRDFHYAGQKRIDMLRVSLQRTKQCFPTTDIFVFHEDYTEEDKASLPPVKEYIPIDFSGGDDHYDPKTERRKGYLMMCRFFCGPLQATPQLQNYTHYMRLDDDSLFIEPYITEARVNELLRYDYVYRTMYNEPPCRADHTLWDFTLGFLRAEGVQERDIVGLKAMLKENWLLNGDTWANNVPYNNFHLSSLALWKNPLVRRYIDAIEREGGVLRYGWFDTSVQAMIALVLRWFTRTSAVCDPTWGYRHNCHISRMHDSAVGGTAPEFFPSSL
jgi:hypothetical protein